MSTAEVENQTASLAESANSLVRNHTYGALGIGVLPFPVIDLVSLSALQVNLVYRLSKMYGVEFKKELVTSSIAALVGGGAPYLLSRYTYSLLKVIPIIGHGIASLSLSVTSGATTYAIGKVFIQHFEAGGTLLDFDPKAVRDYYEEQFKKGKDVAGEAAEATE